MGQKVNPISLRLRVNRNQDSSWFARFQYTKNLFKDFEIRRYINKISQKTNISTGRIFLQILPGKLKIYPFFLKIQTKATLKALFKRKKKFFFRSKYNSYDNKILSTKISLIEEKSVKQKKEWVLLQLKKIPTLSKLLNTDKNNSNYEKTNKIQNFLAFIEKQKKTQNNILEKKLTVPVISSEKNIQLYSWRRELQKDLFRFEKLTLPSEFKKIVKRESFVSKIFSSKNKPTINYLLSKRTLFKWAFKSYFIQSKKNLYSEQIEIKKQVLTNFFAFKILYKNALTGFSKTTQKRKKYLTGMSIEHLEQKLSQNYRLSSKILPLKVKNPAKSAQFLADSLVKNLENLENNRSYRREIKRILQLTNKIHSIKGVRISCSGRLGGVELAKTTMNKAGQTSLHNFSEKIDYATAEASTKFGIIGIKLWVCFA